MPNNEILINQILETDNINGTMYYQFLENAIKMRDRTRFSLIDFPAIFLQINKSRTEKIQDPALYNLLSPTLYKINKLLIDNNDFELFKSEIDHFTTFQVIKSPQEIVRSIEHDFYILSTAFHINKFSIRFSDEIKTRIDFFKFFIKFTLLSDLKYYEFIDKELKLFKSEILKYMDEFKDKEKLKSIFSSELDIENNKIYEEIVNDLENSKKEIVQIIDGNRKSTRFGIKPKLYDFKLNSLIYRTFFIIGSYLIFYKRNKDEDKVNYIYELWNHTTPVKQDVGYLSANIPVEFNAFWLIYLYISGLKGDESWMDWPWHEFDDFHSSKQYMVQYFLLCLTKSGNIDIFPSLDNLNSLNLNKTDKLKEWYDLAYKFSFKHSELIENIDILINESEDWDRLLSYKIKENDIEKEINAKDVLVETKGKIEEVMSKVKEIIPEIEKLFPLDPEKIEDACKEISESYFNNSEIPNIINWRKFDENIDSEKEFNEIGLRLLVNRHCVIQTDFVYCGAIWHDMGFEVALGESNHIFKVINKNENIERYKLINTDVDKIYKEIVSIVKIIKERSDPNLIFLPNDILSKFELHNRGDGSIFDKIVYDEYTSLMADKEKLRIISSNSFKNIIILASESISGIYKQDLVTNKRITIDILDCKEEPFKADVTAKTVVCIEINDINNIKILEI